MKKYLYNLPSIIFNVVETIIIFLVGIAIKLDIKNIIIILVVFSITRMTIGSAKHYKDWKKCLLWTTIIFTSIFLVAKVGIVISIVITIFTAIVLSGKGDIKDIYLWKKQSKYSDIEKYINSNTQSERLVKFEEQLKEKDDIAYTIYHNKFNEKRTFSEMEEELNMDSRRIADKLNEIALSIRVFCNI